MFFSQNPILVTVSGIFFPTNSTNHRIELLVTFNKGTSNERIHTFPQATEGEDAIIDISSAFRSELSTYELSPNIFASSPTVTASVSAQSKYLDLDTVTEGYHPATVSSTSVSARRGGVSESDIYFEKYELDKAEQIPLTTKPFTVPELVSPSSRLQFGTNTHIVPSASKHGDLIPRSTIYGEDAQGYFQVDTSAHRRQFFFLNSRGEIETISFSAFDVLQHQIKREQLTIVHRSSSLVPYPSLKSYTSQSHSSLKFSTGFLSEEWLQWVASDFLTSEHHWLLTPQGLLPVTISFDANITVRNLQGSDLTAISFLVTSSLPGVTTL